MAIHWNTEKFNKYLSRIDGAIADGRYNLAVRLAHRCLRQYYREFILMNNIPTEPMSAENLRLMALSIVKYLNSYFRKYEIPYSERRLVFISLASNIIFLASVNMNEEKAYPTDKALATYARDNVSSIIGYLMRYFS